MPIPGQTISIQDPGLGLVDPATNTPLIMGASSAGTADVVVTLTKASDVTALGEGPLPEYAARQLLLGGGPIYAMRLAATTVGVNTAVTASGGGPTVSLAGAPFDTYTAIITVVAGGILGAGTFRYTLDGGTTESGVLIIPAGGSFPIPNTGITVTFAAGTYVAAETYSWSSTEPRNDASDIASGFTALALLDFEYDYITQSNTYATATTAAAQYDANEGHATTLFNAFEYKRILQNAGPDSASVTITAFISSEGVRTSACYGTATSASAKPIQGRGVRAFGTEMEASVEGARQLISTDLARVANGKLGGAVSPVTAISFDATSDSTLDTAKFTTTRTWKGRPGFFFTNVRFKSPPGSDFLYWQLGRIIDEASEVVQVAQQDFIGRGVRTVASPVGAIDPRDAEGLETEVSTPLAVTLTSPSNVEGTQGHCTAFRYAIDRTNNVLSTQTILSELRIQPFGYIKFITTTIGYSATLSTDEESEA